MKELELSTASANWVQGENSNQWVVRASDGKMLGMFPSGWDEKDCMIAIRLGRQYERRAFDLGVDSGKEASVRKLSPIIKKLNVDVEELSAMNERLSVQLEKHIIGVR